MPVNLNETLSEYSYGFGATFEVCNLLRAVGLSVVPYLPNLREEAGLGFDVAFGKPGRPLFLQFKLGQQLQRFVSTRATPTAPTGLSRPFWRYQIDTAEPNGQFDMLVKAELGGAEVYYVSPRFADWDVYRTHFEQAAVLEHSLLVTPVEIMRRLSGSGQPDGRHKIVYGRSNVHVCSQPVRLSETQLDSIAGGLRSELEQDPQPLKVTQRDVLSALSRVRGEVVAEWSRQHGDVTSTDDRAAYSEIPMQIESSGSGERIVTRYSDRLLRRRQARMSVLSEISRDGDDAAVSAALGQNALMIGAQMVAVTLAD